MHLSGLATVTKPPTHFPMSLLQTPDIRARISLRQCAGLPVSKQTADEVKLGVVGRRVALEFAQVLQAQLWWRRVHVQKAGPSNLSPGWTVHWTLGMAVVSTIESRPRRFLHYPLAQRFRARGRPVAGKSPRPRGGSVCGLSSPGLVLYICF